METLKQHITLVIGLAIPFLVVLLIAGAVFVPRWLDQTPPPATDFIYGYGLGLIYPAYMNPGYNSAYPVPGQVNGKYIYEVVAGKLTRRDAPLPTEGQKDPGFSPVVSEEEPLFYRYSVQSGKSQRLTYAEASALSLISSPKSPDGYSFISGRQGSNFPFGGGYTDGTIYLSKEHHTQKVEFEANTTNQYYYSQNPFIAWVSNVSL